MSGIAEGYNPKMNRRSFLKILGVAGGATIAILGYYNKDEILKWYEKTKKSYTPTTAPVPTSTPTPTKSQLDSLDKIIADLPDYAYKRANELKEKYLSGNPTEKEIKDMEYIVSNSLFSELSKDKSQTYDILTHKFSLQNFKSLFEDLRGRSYSEYLMNNLDSLSQMVNSKVRTEDKYDYKPDIREMNGTYIFNKYKEGKLLLPLDDASLNRLYPDKEKKDAMLMNLWFVPDWTYSKMSATEFTFLTGYEAQKANLERLQDIYNAVTKAHENPGFNPIEPHHTRLTEYGWATREWNDWLDDRANNNWPNTVAAFREIDEIISSDTEFKEKWDMIKFIFGYARSSGLPKWSIDLCFGYEAHMINMLPVTYKAFGVPIIHASSAPSDRLQVTEFVVGGIPSDIMDKVRTDLSKHEIVDFGNYGISLYSPKKPMIDDGAKKLVYGLRAGEEKVSWTIN